MPLLATSQLVRSASYTGTEDLLLEAAMTESTKSEPDVDSLQQGTEADDGSLSNHEYSGLELTAS